MEAVISLNNIIIYIYIKDIVYLYRLFIFNYLRVFFIIAIIWFPIINILRKFDSSVYR